MHNAFRIQTLKCDALFSPLFDLCSENILSDGLRLFLLNIGKEFADNWKIIWNLSLCYSSDRSLSLKQACVLRKGIFTASWKVWVGGKWVKEKQPDDFWSWWTNKKKEEEETRLVFNLGHKHVFVPTETQVKAGFISPIILQCLQQKKVSVLVLPNCCVLHTKINLTLPE